MNKVLEHTLHLTDKLAFSTFEAAKRAAICRSLIYRAINSGDLVAHKVGRRTIVLASDLEAFLARSPRMPAKEAAAADDETAGAGRDEDAAA